MSLGALQERWIEKHDELRSSQDPNGQLYAAPFLSVPDPNPPTSANAPIMLVGKATEGCFFLEQFERDRAKGLSVGERAQNMREYIEDLQTDGHHLERKRSGFWRFHRAIRTALGTRVIWTNLVKIGTCKGTPEYGFVSEQACLALETLKAEIDLYRPALIIFVTHWFGRHEIVSKLLCVDKNTEENEDGIYLERVRTGESPAVLWTRHPGRPRKEIFNKWISAAERLYRSPQ